MAQNRHMVLDDFVALDDYKPIISVAARFHCAKIVGRMNITSVTSGTRRRATQSIAYVKPL